MSKQNKVVNIPTSLFLNQLLQKLIQEFIDSQKSTFTKDDMVNHLSEKLKELAPSLFDEVYERELTQRKEEVRETIYSSFYKQVMNENGFKTFEEAAQHVGANLESYKPLIKEHSEKALVEFARTLAD